jgi:hypothetical protein
MINFSLIYLIYLFFLNIFLFLKHWYIDALKNFLNFWANTIQKLDKNFAVKINLINFFEPLYKDYSIIGRFVGIILRLLRILIGLLIYLIISFIILGFILFWLLIPLILIYKQFIN